MLFISCRLSSRIVFCKVTRQSPLRIGSCLDEVTLIPRGTHLVLFRMFTCLTLCSSGVAVQHILSWSPSLTAIALYFFVCFANPSTVTTTCHYFFKLLQDYCSFSLIPNAWTNNIVLLINFNRLHRCLAANRCKLEPCYVRPSLSNVNFWFIGISHCIVR